jgi:hypothetical protein
MRCSRTSALPGRGRALNGDQRRQVPTARQQVRTSTIRRPQVTATDDQLWLCRAQILSGAPRRDVTPSAARRHTQHVSQSAGQLSRKKVQLLRVFGLVVEYLTRVLQQLRRHAELERLDVVRQAGDSTVCRPAPPTGEASVRPVPSSPRAPLGDLGVECRRAGGCRVAHRVTPRAGLTGCRVAQTVAGLVDQGQVDWRRRRAAMAAARTPGRRTPAADR